MKNYHDYDDKIMIMMLHKDSKFYDNDNDNETVLELEIFLMVTNVGKCLASTIFFNCCKSW